METLFTKEILPVSPEKCEHHLRHKKFQSLNGDFVGFLKTVGVNEGSLALLQR